MLSALAVVASAAEEPANTPLAHSVAELRSSIGKWQVITEFLNDDGSIARSVPGTYDFSWVVEDKVISGKNHIPDLQQSSAILFYVRESDAVIEMVAVGADGRLWVMTGELGGSTRYTQTIRTDGGGTLQLRFTRYNVTDTGFESRMERTTDGGQNWLPGNHQVFTRESESVEPYKPVADDKQH